MKSPKRKAILQLLHCKQKCKFEKISKNVCQKSDKFGSNSDSKDWKTNLQTSAFPPEDVLLKTFNAVSQTDR